MSSHCSRGQVASGRGLGGAARGRGALPTPECRQERPGGGAVACQGGLARCCEAGSAWRGSAERAKAVGASVSARPRGCNTRALGASSARTECARRNAMALQSAWLELGFSRVGYNLRQNYLTCWFGQGIKSIVQTRTHVKTDHARKVFDKMPRALRHFLEWPKSPDQCLCG